jgi:hypothetical protein
MAGPLVLSLSLLVVPSLPPPLLQSSRLHPPVARPAVGPGTTEHENKTNLLYVERVAASNLNQIPTASVSPQTPDCNGPPRIKVLVRLVWNLVNECHKKHALDASAYTLASLGLEKCSD